MKSNNNLSNKNLSEKMEDYYANKSSDADSHELENMALEDDFMADAMEGLDSFPGALSSVPDFPKEKIYTGIYVSLFTVMASFLVWFLVFNPEVNEKKVVEIDENKTVVINSNPEVENKVPSEINETIEKSEVVSQPKIIDLTKEKNIEYPIRERLGLQKEELSPIKWEKKHATGLAKAKVKIISFHSFLAVDYSVIYVNSQDFDSEIKGILANRENNNSEDKFGEKVTTNKEFTYKEYLKESLGYLKNKNYTLATENFKTILKHYPQDVNAQFYLGLIYFNQNENEKSISQLDKVVLNSFQFFKEDAEWLIAKATQKQGKLKKAAVLFKIIKEKGGYYSYQIK